MAALHAVAQSPPLPRGGLTFSSAERARQKAKPALLPAQKGNEAGANAFREERHGNMITGALAAFLANLCRPTALLQADAARLHSLPPVWHNNLFRPASFQGLAARRRNAHPHALPPISKNAAFPAIFLGNAFAVRHGKNETRIRLPEISIAAKEAAGERTLSGDYTVTVKWVEGRSKRHPHCLRANCAFEV